MFLVSVFPRDDLRWWWVWAGIRPGRCGPRGHGRARRCAYHSSGLSGADGDSGSNLPVLPQQTESRKRNESSARRFSPKPWQQMKLFSSYFSLLMLSVFKAKINCVVYIMYCVYSEGASLHQKAQIWNNFWFELSYANHATYATKCPVSLLPRSLSPGC